MENRRRMRVGLALGGGVVRGLAHIGVLSVLLEAGIPIDCVAGSSVGSFIGAIYCAGMRVDQVLEVSRKVRWWHLARPVWPFRGLVSFDPLARWLVNQLGDLDFAQLATPFAAVATDLDTGSPVRLCAGRVAPAVQASCSVPGFVSPVKMNGMLLGDGSLSDTIPVDIARSLGADYVIGVDILTSQIRPRWGPFGMGLTAMEILVQRAGGGVNDADCLIVPNLGGQTYLRFRRYEDLFQRGRAAALEKLDQIRGDLQLGSPTASLSAGEPPLNG